MSDESKKNDTKNMFMSNLVQLLHVIIALYIYFGGILFRKNVVMLLIHVGACIAIMAQWELYGHCILTDFENYYSGSDTVNKTTNSPKSVFIEYIENALNLSEQTSTILLTLTTPLAAYISLYLLYKVKCTKK
jgi:ammonia channel protein AmtB